MNRRNDALLVLWLMFVLIVVWVVLVWDWEMVR